MCRLAGLGIFAVLVGCGGGVPVGGEADLAHVVGADLAPASDVDMAGASASSSDMANVVPTDLALADLAPSPDLTPPCGINPGDACCPDDSCPGLAGSMVTLTCMNHSGTQGVVDKRCMQYIGASCGQFPASCCNANGSPQSSGDYCTLGGGGQPVEYCINGTCQS